MFSFTGLALRRLSLRHRCGQGLPKHPFHASLRQRDRPTIPVSLP
jgi:hypothetical protein